MLTPNILQARHFHHIATQNVPPGLVLIHKLLSSHNSINTEIESSIYKPPQQSDRVALWLLNLRINRLSSLKKTRRCFPLNLPGGITKEDTYWLILRHLLTYRANGCGSEAAGPSEADSEAWGCTNRMLHNTHRVVSN